MNQVVKSLVAHRFESDGPVGPGQRALILWSTAMPCRLDSIDFQPGPEWRVTVSIPPTKIALVNLEFPDGVCMVPGQTLRIEYENVGAKPAVGRVTLWIEPHRESFGPVLS